MTAFGHGRHTCPARPFSLAAMAMTLTRLFTHYELAPRWTTYPRPVPAQIGGVARASSSCPADYALRTAT